MKTSIMTPNHNSHLLLLEKLKTLAIIQELLAAISIHFIDSEESQQHPKRNFQNIYAQMIVKVDSHPPLLENIRAIVRSQTFIVEQKVEQGVDIK